MKISDIFNISRGSVISEQDIYFNFCPNGVPVYSSQTENDGCMGTVSIEFYEKSSRKGEPETITWTTDGVNAGKFFYRNEKYLYTNVCGKLELKSEFSPKEINLKYICIILNNLSKEETNSRNSNPKLMSRQVEKIEINIPSIQEQNEVVEQYDKLKGIRDSINQSLRSINLLLNKSVYIKYPNTETKISDIFYVKTGSRIIESDVYKHKGKIPCVTAQTLNNGIAWYADEKWLSEKFNDKIVNEAECITWSKDGYYAGKIFYRNYRFYPNDHCGVLILKDEYKKNLNLKWFYFTMEPYIKKFVSQDNSQPMLYNGVMANIPVIYPFPLIEYQTKIIEQYEKLEVFKEKLEKVLSKISM